jgi:hypothetical protein
MSLVKSNAVQVGQSPTATQNFTLEVPSSSDGTIKLARGNAGETTQDVLNVDVSGNINALVKSTGSNTSRSLANRFADVVNVKDFGAVGDGVTDDGPAIQNAINSLGQNGGTVYIPNTMRCLVDSSITISRHVSLVGPNKMLGSPQDNNYTPYNLVGGAIILNSAATINTEGNSTIFGLLIHRKGMTFPAPNASAFAGTAIIVGGDDVSVLNCMILGFNRAIDNGIGAFPQRQKFAYILMDNNNGIRIRNCFDVPYVDNCHAWPFATIAAGPAGTKDFRSGIAYEIGPTCDWGKFTNCFAYGYLRGFYLNQVNNVTLIGCSVDNLPPPLAPNSIGFEVAGISLDTKFIGCQAAANDEAGIYLVNDGWTTIEGFTSWGTTRNAIRIGSGTAHAIIKGSGVRENENFVTCDNATSEVIFDGNYAYNVTNKILNYSVQNTRTIIGNNNNVNLTTYTNPYTYTIVCGSTTPNADICSLPQYGNVFYVNGTNNFSRLTYGWPGRIVVLKFVDVLTVTGTISPTPTQEEIVLDGPTFTTAAGDTLTLIHDGIAWSEISRTPRNP